VEIQDLKASGARHMEWLHGKGRKIAELNKRLAEYEEFNGLPGAIGENECPGWAKTDWAKGISNDSPSRHQHKPQYTRVKVLLVR
jgi:hypothetical protein